MITIEDLFCRHTCIWPEHLSKLRIRKLPRCSDPEIMKIHKVLKNWKEAQDLCTAPALLEPCDTAHKIFQTQVLKGNYMEPKRAATKAATSMGWGMWQMPLECLLRLFMSCFLPGWPPWPQSQQRPQVLLCQDQWSLTGQLKTGSSLSLSSLLVSHEAWKELSWKKQQFSSPLRICQILITVKRP